MKKIKTLLVIALVAVFGCMQANAEFRFGIKAGLNVNKLHFNEKTFDADNRCGFTAGVTTEFIVPAIGVGFDLSAMYTRMNSHVDQQDGKNIDANFGKDFLEIPLNIRYKLSIPAISKIFAPYVFTGPTLALKLNGGNNNSFKAKTAQWGWNIGLGIQLIKHLQIGAGYTFGINNIVEKVPQVSEQSTPTALKLKNNYWTVTAAWLF